MDYRRFDNDSALFDPENLSSSTNIAFGFVVIYLSYHFLRYFRLIPQVLLWNALVYYLPSRLLLDQAERRELKVDGTLSQKHAAKSDVVRNAFSTAAGVASLLKVPGDTLLGWATGLSRTKLPSDAPPGLGNWDNSCYQNSVLQGLSALGSLKSFLEETHGADADTTGSTGASLLTTMNNLNNSSNNGKRLWTPPKLKSMCSWQQQDAQEYFSKIMDDVGEEATKKVISDGQKKHGLESAVRPDMEPDAKRQRTNDANLRNPMEGFIAQRVACTKCGYSDGLSMIPFNCLTVPLGTSPVCDIEDCLNDYTQLEDINEVECSKCTMLQWKQQLEQMSDSSSEAPEYTSVAVDSKIMALPPEVRAQTLERLESIRTAVNEDDFSDEALNVKCQIPKAGRASTTKTRQAVIGRAPESLVIHVNRSVFDELSGIQRKNHAHVRYPLSLDLRSWILNQKRAKGSKICGQPHLATRSLLDDSTTSNSPCVYNLKAIVTHSGHHESGHYVCYRNYPVRRRLGPAEGTPGADDSEVKYTEEPQWWRLSDEDVTSVSEQAVVGQDGAFMLFYERETVDAVPTPSPAAQPIAEAIEKVDVPAEPTEPKPLPLPSIASSPRGNSVPAQRPSKPRGDLDVRPTPSTTPTSPALGTGQRRASAATMAAVAAAAAASNTRSRRSIFDRDIQTTLMRASRLRQSSGASLSDHASSGFASAANFWPVAAI